MVAMVAYATHVAVANAMQTFAQINKFSNQLEQQKYVLCLPMS